MLASVTVRAPAKVNLALGVGPLRDDGFHGLATVFHAVSLYDDLVATPLAPGSGAPPAWSTANERTDQAACGRLNSH